MQKRDSPNLGVSTEAHLALPAPAHSSSLIASTVNLKDFCLPLAALSSHLQLRLKLTKKKKKNQQQTELSQPQHHLLPNVTHLWTSCELNGFLKSKFAVTASWLKSPVSKSKAFSVKNTLYHSCFLALQLLWWLKLNKSPVKSYKRIGAVWQHMLLHGGFVIAFHYLQMLFIGNAS